MNVERIAAADFVAELADRFQIRQAFNIAHGAANFAQQDLRARFLRHQPDPRFNLICHMRDHLHAAPQVFPLALLGDDRAVNLACGDVVKAQQVLVNETLVMAQIQIGFRAIVGYEDLAMLDRIHRPRIYI